MTIEEYQDMEIEKLFLRLSRSKFRSRFHLREKEKQYVKDKGFDVISSHASDFVRQRLAPKVILNDGHQTPMSGHPVFIAQHATATCCRGCLFKWHHIPKNRELSEEEIAYIIRVIMKWIEKEVKVWQ